MSILLILACLSQFVSASKAQSQYVYVSAVLDGERMVLSNGDRVQLVGVDAMEKFGAAEALNEALRLGIDPESVTAKGSIEGLYLQLLVRSRSVLVSYIDEVESGPAESGFRPAYVSVLRSDGKLDYIVNKKMISDGFAMVDLNASFHYRDQFIQLQQEAMNGQRGRWAYTTIPIPFANTGGVSPSRNADIYSECRTIKGCVWVSQENTTIGYWRSAQGYKCPCAN